MTIKEILLAARALLLNGWCLGAYALDIRGNQVSPEKDTATSFCMMGAIRRVSPNFDRYKHGALYQLESVVPREQGKSLGWWQDQQGRTLDDVLAAFDKAIDKSP